MTFQQVFSRVLRGVEKSFHTLMMVLSRSISPFVVGDSDDEAKTECEIHLRWHVDTAAGSDMPEDTVFNRLVRSLDLRSEGVRLV